MGILNQVKFAVIFLPVFLTVAVAQDRIEIKGYYKEDGSYVKQRAADLIETESDSGVFPALSDNLKIRKKEISRFYEGKVGTAKVSFPACHSGLVLYLERLDKSNVDMFRKIRKYGASIEKDSKVIITKIKINAKTIDIELNNGGYGDYIDVSGRVLAGIISVGLTELMDHSQARMQRGSHLRIKSEKKFTKQDLDFEKIREYLSPVLEI